MRFEDQRQKMVESQLLTRGIKDQSVINAFLKVKRDAFVDDQWKAFAYKDHPLTIGCGQTISQPFIVAVMMQLLQLQPTDRVLEIGTGCGYVSALLAEIVTEVYTIERIEDLMNRAKSSLKLLGYKNIFFKIGDGTLGWINTIPQISQFDKIIVSAGGPSVPPALLEQLAEGGKLIIPLGKMSVQDLTLYEKVDGNIVSSEQGGCVFVPLIGQDGWA
jgi:protein-L-isoaspartate(D-aspartate) O-methyltransferase